MAYEMKEGQGSLFREKEKQSDNHPDYKGTCVVNGNTLQIAGWLKESKSGLKYMSLSIQPPREKGEKPKPAKVEFDDDAPPF